MAHNNENIQAFSLSFPDIMTKLYLTWESSEKEKQDLQYEVDKCKTHIDEFTAVHTELLKNFEKLQSINTEYEKEIVQLKKKLADAEDDQKQFRKVSHIITMDRENNNYKQQIAILERRVAFYQNQCSNKKPSNDIMKIDAQTDTDDLLYEICNDNEQFNHSLTNIINISEINNNKETDTITYGDDINVKEKKIKGVIYYVSDNGDVYAKNDDDSIGELKGKIEILSSGKTKVKWCKSP